MVLVRPFGPTEKRRLKAKRLNGPWTGWRRGPGFEPTRMTHPLFLLLVITIGTRKAAMLGIELVKFVADGGKEPARPRAEYSQQVWKMTRERARQQVASLSR